MWIAQKVIEKYESGSDWNYDFRMLSGEDPGERRIRQHTFVLDDDMYMEYGRTELIKELQTLEKRGLIRIKWYQLGSYAESFTYQLQDIPAFYKYLDRIPKPLLVERELEYVDNYLNDVHNGWIREVLLKERAKIEEGKLPDDEHGTKEYRECLKGLDRLDGPVFKRVFSKQYLNNSKRFEQKYQGRIIAAARRYHENIDEEMSDTQVLSEIYLEEYAQELAVKGALHLVLEGKELHLEDFRYGTILNSQTLERAKIMESQPIRRIVSVENKANFVSMPFEEGTLYLFSHGFFSPREREFLNRLRAALEKQVSEGGRQVEYFHTGDLDYGGFRIFQYIKENIFPELKPMQMDTDVYRRYCEYGETLTEPMRRNLTKISEIWTGNDNYKELKELIAEMLHSGYILEQEAFLIHKGE